ncbi:MAG: cytochrome c5 family protein [Xanthomonadales bacterium]|nr:cytochrome c5 family protein [Xanthomonadales bacterium]
MKRFSGIIVGLVIVTILIIVIAVGYDNTDPLANPSRAAKAAERIQPVASVRTELPAPAAQDVVIEAPVAGDAVAVAAAEIDGESVYAAVCLACHLSGAAGAPIPGSDAWAERAAKGLDELTYSAINGIGIMPAKGGRMDLSDDEVRAAVQHMLDL